jgi:hypothetical protein
METNAKFGAYLGVIAFVLAADGVFAGHLIALAGAIAIAVPAAVLLANEAGR